ncbi:L-ascorbate metabolism protein UlaG (beta-lactamase superfamily) [Hamadaea flava]|uniref:MBL fold metallo-hydrolase n=1 Tax=Hamadaea flava TaxID=1742688 RepID=A0ABV8LPA7_9ACTN|nr:MBL fold metallo-hydrolase [Hamadaea flava]MCP2323026.1 L-ascorbate metabolism protein UlaG (beta-lactamase superfamily) [Hamadaea flava]
MRITWLGHSAVLIEVPGLRLLADPLVRRRIGGLVRAKPLPEVAAHLARRGPPVDAVLVSHLHHDHCDLPSLRALRAPVVLAPPRSGAWLRRQGVDGVIEATVGDGTHLGAGVTVTAVHAEHQGRREPRGPSAEAVGHVVDTPDGSVWLAGDTGLHQSFRDLRYATRTGRLDVAVVPVWGWGPTLGPGHMDPRTAARAAVLSGASQAIPVHWGTLHPLGLRRFMGSVLTQPGPLFAEALYGTGVRPHVLRVGEYLDV